MIIHNDTELIGTMGLLMLINSQSRQGRVLAIVPIVDQVKESFRGRRRLCKHIDVMEERFKTYLSVEDQAELDIRSKDLLKDWKERCQRGEIVF